jgi:uncharacterized protein (DUF305 family)
VPVRKMVGLGLALILLAGCDDKQALAKAPPAPSPSVQAPNSADVLFADMMVVHHAQAVRMSKSLIAKPGLTERPRLIAEFIAHDQQREIDETNAWLVAWGRPAADPADPVITSLHGSGGSGHGMVPEKDLRAAEKAPTAEATRLYLTQMIEHHAGMVTMARAVLEDGANVYIHGLAKHIINEQTAEIDAMRALL